MKAPEDFLRQLELLFENYEKEVNEKRSTGLLAENTTKTYLLHTGNFVRWCRGEFVPGARNSK
ncbi:hypothetical protein YDYSY3_37950 [Paenibacillus chitinolyticus]|nr:hypothetical protein YDYSY3_37950 [Paenibacillus chitinolyticus]